jgi:carboxylate-amine ligase
MAEPYDEARDASGEPREHYRELLAHLEGADLRALAEGVHHAVEARRMAYGPGGAEEFVLDPVPRVHTAAEWAQLAAGLAQRLRALNAFLADVHGPQRLLREGVVPARVLDSAFAEPDAVGLPVRGAPCAVAGPDLVRDADGRLLVLEDNLRLPSGLGYALAAREVIAPTLGAHGAVPAELVGAALSAFAAALRAAAPEGVDEPEAVVLTDPRDNDARFEHRELARRLGLPLVVLEDLEVTPDAHVRRRDERGRGHPVHVVYRRTNIDVLRDAYGNPTALHALLEPVRAGHVGVVNAFGVGVADDKLTHVHVPALIRELLGEEPLLDQPEGRDLAVAEHREEVLGDPERWVLKRRAEAGGKGVLMGAGVPREELEEAMAADPGEWVAQEHVELSVHPTVVDGRLEPRRVDLRPLVFAAGDEVHVAPGALCRVSLDPDQPLVNMTAGGGIKDVWVVGAD